MTDYSEMKFDLEAYAEPVKAVKSSGDGTPRNTVKLPANLVAKLGVVGEKPAKKGTGDWFGITFDDGVEAAEIIAAMRLVTNADGHGLKTHIDPLSHDYERVVLTKPKVAKSGVIPLIDVKGSIRIGFLVQATKANRSPKVV